MRPGFESSAGTASIHLDVYPQRREHSWDGYVRYIKVLISFHFISCHFISFHLNVKELEGVSFNFQVSKCLSLMMGGSCLT
jgi:hypothetical protein